MSSADDKIVSLKEIQSLDISEQVKNFVTGMLSNIKELGSDVPEMDADIKEYGEYILLLTRLERKGDTYEFTFNETPGQSIQEVESNIKAFLLTKTFCIVEINIYKALKPTSYRLNDLSSEVMIDKTETSEEPIGKVSSLMLPRSHSLVNSILDAKPSPAFKKQAQLNIFNSLSQREKDKIQKEVASGKITIESINRQGHGIHLNQGEYKLIDCICELLHEKSLNVSDKKSISSYYTGNSMPVAYYYKDTQMYDPVIVITLYELTKKYKGGDKITGGDRDNVKKLLEGLADGAGKKFLVKYPIKINGKEKIIEDFVPLISVNNVKDPHTIEKKSGVLQYEYIIRLNHIFIDQIGSQFYRYIPNINKRMADAMAMAEIKKPSSSPYLLRDILVRQFSRGRTEYSIGLYETFKGGQGLLWIITRNYMEVSKKAIAIDWFKKSVKVCKNLGLINDWKYNEETEVVTFYINTNWS